MENDLFENIIDCFRYIGGEMMAQLFSFTPSSDIDHTSRTCSDAHFSAHPLCVIECTFCNPGIKPPSQCGTHGNLKSLLEFEQVNSFVNQKGLLNNIGKISPAKTPKIKLIKTTRSITPALQQVKINPAGNGMALLTNDRWVKK